MYISFSFFSVSDSEAQDARLISTDSFDLPCTPRSHSNGFRIHVTFQSNFKSQNANDFIQPSESFFLRIFLKYGMVNDIVISQYTYNPVSDLVLCFKSFIFTDRVLFLFLFLSLTSGLSIW